MEAVAHARFQRYKPTKVAQVLDEVRGRSVAEADSRLPYLRRRGADLVLKTIDSAAANLAVRLGKALDPAQVFVTAAWVGQGPMKHLRRVLPAPQGRAMTIKRKVCHLTVRVSDQRPKRTTKKR